MIRRIKEGFGIEEAPGLYQKVYKIVRDNHINASVIDSDDSDDNGFVEINIHGDWKHDHLRLKYLLGQAFGTVLWREKNHYPSDDDCYEAEYMVYLADPKPETTNWTNESINMTRKRKLKEGTRGFISPNEAAEHYYEYGNYVLWPDNIKDELRSYGYDEDFISEVFYIMNEMADDDAVREEEYADGDLEDTFNYAMGESVNRRKLKESLYSIVYDYDNEYETERNCREEFEGTWSELQDYIKQMREQGCYNIDANEIDDGYYDDEPDEYYEDEEYDEPVFDESVQPGFDRIATDKFRGSIDIPERLLDTVCNYLVSNDIVFRTYTLKNGLIRIRGNMTQREIWELNDFVARVQ